MPLEQHRQFSRRLGGVFLGQLEHRVLHDVERASLVPDGEHRLLERAPFDFREKTRNFLLWRPVWAIRLKAATIIGSKLTVSLKMPAPHVAAWQPGLTGRGFAA